MIILNAEETKLALPMGASIEAMKVAFHALSSGQVEMPLRTRIPVSKHDGQSLLMPAYIKDIEAEALTVKIVSVFNKNPSRGLPLIHAAVLVLDESSGQIEALIEGGTLTAIRTGAGSGAASDCLANPTASSVAIIGAGVQAATQLEAICTVRKISRVRVFSPRQKQAEAFAIANGGRGPIPDDLTVVESASEAISDADIICTATTSYTPVFEDADLKPGCHINAVGSYMPEMSEIPSETIARANVFVDSREAAGKESGEIAQNLASGHLALDSIYEIGDVLMQRPTQHHNPEQITLFKSVGVAVQDAAAGKLALANARKMNLGTRVEF